jgi:hypothetical protein
MVRPQLNLSFDDHPDLPEKLRKLCKYKGYKISDFCARVLDRAISDEMAGTGGVVSGNSSHQDLENLRSQVSQLTEDYLSLKTQENLLGKLRSQVNQLTEELRSLSHSHGEEISQLKASVSLSETGRVKSNHIPQSRSDTSNIKCMVCGQVGGHRKSGLSEGKQLYYCGNRDHTTKGGKPYRSHKFEVVSQD